MSSSHLRLFLSAFVSFVFYFSWTFWANYSEDIPSSITLRAALVQSCYSAFVTLFFTYILETLVNKYRKLRVSLLFVVPIICSIHSKTKQNIAILNTINNAVNHSADYFNSKRFTVSLLIPLIPLSIQSSLVIIVNLLNATPNLFLTVLPSIIFTAIYAYSYTLSLLKINSKK